tara:strand:- start:140 stop:676 length:537 start_codon:yes stop_codon:yes gene_type:complete
MKELIAIQKELKAPKGQMNKFGNYKYRSCEDILEAVKPLLAKHNATILITDEVKSVNEYMYIEAIVVFSVGKESLSVKAQAGINPNRKGMDIAQSFGSSSSYARKYALAGLLLLDDTKDADSKDNTEENKPASKEDFEDAKQTLREAHEMGSLKDAYHELPSALKTQLRDFANDLRAS